MSEKDDKPIIDLFEKQIRKFIEARRPPVEIREKVDLGYSFSDLTLEIFEIRPLWNDPDEKINSPVAKARFIKSRNLWKIYWRRASGKWEAYEPEPEVKLLADFFKVLNEDKYGCFCG